MKELEIGRSNRIFSATISKIYLLTISKITDGE
jgi:hypothetical protein